MRALLPPSQSRCLEEDQSASHPAVSLDFEGDASALRGAASATLSALINTQAGQLAELLSGADHFRKVLSWISC